MKARNTITTMSETRKKDRFLCKCGTSQCRYDFCQEYYPTKCWCGRKLPKENSKRWKPKYVEQKQERTAKEKKEIVAKFWEELPDKFRYLFVNFIVKDGELQGTLPSWKGMKINS